ncbi:P-loop containing nucleoside triphosphate hydrolase protein [Bisporella sp. PMI_857]|nr:P-loop containing nucleoside triphosphate hydrolase protein [Bisporella sp. PMI_857]
MAYSLLGIFGIFLPLIYGEGRENALRRLLEEVNKSPDMPLASIFSVPFRRDPDFVYRGVLLNQIHQKCAVPGSWTALVGLGGVGKSQLAIEYSYQIREQSQKTWVFWVHASNAVRFEQGYRDIADRLKISGREDPKANIFTLVHSYLHDKLMGQWQLILDNVDDAGFLFMAPKGGHYPQSNGFGDRNSQPLLSFIPQCQNGSILITTRSRNAALKLVEENDIVKVDPMEDSLALTLLEKKLGVQGGSSDFAELTAALEFMPLAIVQAAAYISQRAPRCSVREYLEQFQKSDHKKIRLLQNEAGHLRRDWEASNSILITWQISFDYLRLNRPSAADLLSLMSFFDRQGISEALLKIQPEEESSDSHVAEDSEEDILSGASQDDQFEASVNALREFSFISVSVDGTTFEMHRLVQLATQKWLEASAQLEKWRQRYVKNLYTVFPIGEHEHWGKCQSLFPHAKSAVTQ